MLRRLTVRDFVLVDRLEMDFHSGFTALTGETGTGKSILVDALAMLLGERGDATVVRPRAAKAEVEAEFDVPPGSPLAAWLDEQALAEDDRCVLRRVIEAGGRSRGFINGRATTVQQLKAAGEGLVDIYGQHGHQSLLRPAAQRDLLDAFGGLAPQAREVESAYRAWRACRLRREAWEKDAAALAAERHALEIQERELAALGLTPESWKTLQADHARLSHAASLLEAADSALDVLVEQEQAVESQLAGVISRLSAGLEHDAGLTAIVEMLESAQIQVREAGHELRRYRDGLDLDPARLRELERVLAAAHGAARKYRISVEDIPQVLADCGARLAELGEGDSATTLRQAEEEARGRYLEQAPALGKKRAQAARRLSGMVTEAMQRLALEGGSFRVVLSALEEGGPGGLEQAEFQVTPHADAPLRPLAKIASGGELSRIGLAIQAAASTAAGVPTLVFDEVDVGIGGRVAAVVGELLRELGRRYQVLCITHLPQVAAAADQQWQVVKTVSDGVATSQVLPLDAAQRVEEIARMLGGAAITDTTRRHAAELLAGAAPAGRSGGSRSKSL